MSEYESRQQPQHVVVHIVPPKVPHHIRAAFQFVDMCHEFMQPKKRQETLGNEVFEQPALHPASEDVYYAACVALGNYFRNPPAMMLIGEEDAETGETITEERQEDVGEGGVRGADEAGGAVQGVDGPG